MPTQFRIRERLGARTSRRPSPITTSQTPPPTGVQTSASNSSSTANNLPTPSPSPLPSSLPVPTENPAFVQALKRHIRGLSPEERQAFDNCSSITPDSLIAKVKNYDDTHNSSSYSRKCISGIEGFLIAVDAYLKPLSIMIAHSPEISSLVVGGAKLIVQLGLRFANFFNKLTEMMENLSGHLNYLSRYAKCFDKSKEVQEALSAAYGDLLKFFTGARKVFVDNKGNYSRWVSFRIFLTVTWEPFEENFNSLLSEFRNHVDIVIRTASVEEYERLRSERLLDNEGKEDEERSKLLLWLSQLDFDEDHNRIFKKRHEDTGNWLVDSPEFKEWDDSGDSSLLWCYGNPGVGKSVLASLVLETISTKYSLDSRTGIAFVYFNFQDQETQKSIKIISTMIKQLARQKRILPSGLKHLYKTYHRDAKFPTEEKLEAQFLDISKTFDQVFLIMDAMDEFEDRKEFLSMISKFTKDSSVTCKIFVTSRREADIENAFNRCGFGIIQIEAKKVDADIATYVRHEVERRTKEVRIIIDEELQGKIKNTLTSKSEGMFLWVKYQLDFIYDQPSARHITTALDTLPVDMNATYTRVLRKIDKQVPAKREIAQRLLMWVLCAKRPLTLKEMSIAVSLKPNLERHKDLEYYDAETLLETCCNLIVFENGSFRPFHYTVQEFLTSTKPDLVDSIDLALFKKYQVTVNDHARLAEACLLYFLLPDLADADMDFPHTFKADHPFSVYAAAYWHYHVKDLTELPRSLAQYIDTIFEDNHRNSLLWAYRSARDEFMQTQSIAPLNYCLSLDILHLFQRSHQFDISITNLEEYKDALHHAAHGGSISNIKSLLEMGFSVNSFDNSNKTPLYYAALAEHKEASILLIENGANVNSQCGGDLSNALNAAAFHGYGEVAGSLLDRGADVNAQGGEYGNALQAAAYGGRSLEIVQILLDRGADVNARGGEYGNALQAAVYLENLEIVQMLLDRGADVNAQGGKYGNALIAARSFSGKSSAIYKLLMKAGARET